MPQVVSFCKLVSEAPHFKGTSLNNMRVEVEADGHTDLFPFLGYKFLFSPFSDHRLDSASAVSVG
jgi:hypothetical protein